MIVPYVLLKELSHNSSGPTRVAREQDLDLPHRLNDLEKFCVNFVCIQVVDGGLLIVQAYPVPTPQLCKVGKFKDVRVLV